MITPPAAGGAAAIAVIATAAVLILPHGAASSPGTGAGIQVAPVRLTLAPGTTGRARVTVADTGPDPETLAIRGYTLASTGRPVPLSWVRGASITLAPGGEDASLVTITVPAGATPGRYRGSILASAAPGAPGGLSFGAAALTDLVVTVTGHRP